MRDRVAYLERQLDIRTEELREHRRLIAGLIERVPELEDRRDEQEAPPEPPGSPPEPPEGHQEDTGQEPPGHGSSRSWWRRFFGL